jgi:ribosome-associated translation inhibitor RaiA
MKMQVPLQVTFRHVPHSKTIELGINQQLEKLYHFCDRIIRCQVVVEAPHQHHRQGNVYHVRINLTLPGEELVIKQNSSPDQKHDNIHLTIRHAFDVAQRKLKRYSSMQNA